MHFSRIAVEHDKMGGVPCIRERQVVNMTQAVVKGKIRAAGVNLTERLEDLL